MIELTSLDQMRGWRRQVSLDSRIGFVPTMGALHEGHLSLVQQARSECDTVVASIFVNPTQFEDPKDLATYPKTLHQDLLMLSSAGVDAVFLPTADQMYPQGDHFQITEDSLSQLFCGAYRPGHFKGVLTVVMKLFHLVLPQAAYFGEKDFQQLQLIKGMVEAFFLDIDIRSCPTVRETDGLAMSSRNRKLAPEQRIKALEFHKILKGSPSATEAKSTLSQSGFLVDYVEDYQGRRLGAIRIGEVRLIDNVIL